MSAIITYHCINCGGPLKFNPEKQKYTCEYCLSEFTETKLIDNEETGAAKAGDPFLYNCPSCGAEILTDETTAASFCYYCHNPVILSGRLSGEYHPDYVIPFSIKKEKAIDIFNSWMKRKKFTPKAFYNEEQIEKISGVYFPYMLYSCLAEGSLEAEADRLRVWVSGDKRFTETQTYKVQRQGAMPVKFVPRNALKKANKELVEGVLPYETQKLKPFSMSCLSGFFAERRDMGKEEFTEDVKAEIRTFAQDSIRNSIPSYDRVNIQSSQVSLKDEKWEYALLPVWTLTYHDETKNQMYYFTVNGQTGKVCGKLPVDKNKLLLLFAEIFFPVFIALLIVGYFI